LPSDLRRLHQLLAGYRKRIAVGDAAGAEAYASSVDRKLEHYRYPTPAEWATLLEEAGLLLLYTRYYIPAPVAAIWDTANVTYGITEGSSPFFRWLAEHGRISLDPAEAILQPSVISPLPEVLTVKETDLVLETAGRIQQGDWKTGAWRLGTVTPKHGTLYFVKASRYFLSVPYLTRKQLKSVSKRTIYIKESRYAPR